MSIRIIDIKNSSNASQEYILLKATEDLNIGNYAIVDKTFDTAGNPSNIFKHFYRFPDKKIAKDENVLLYTGKGTNYVGRLTSNNQLVHVFYWNSDKPIWNDLAGDRVELLYVKTVDHKPVPPKASPTIKFKLNK